MGGKDSKETSDEFMKGKMSSSRHRMKGMFGKEMCFHKLTRPSQLVPPLFSVTLVFVRDEI